MEKRLLLLVYDATRLCGLSKQVKTTRVVCGVGVWWDWSWPSRCNDGGRKCRSGERV